MTKRKAQVAQSLPKPQISTGYSPKEAALILGSRFDGKKIRRLLRKGSLKGELLGGRWYIPATSIRALLKKAQSSGVEEVTETKAAAEPKVSAASTILAKVEEIKSEAEASA